MAAPRTTAPLALDSTAHGQASGWRRNEDLIDALPYIDTLPAELKRQVDAVIEEELKRGAKRPSDYLKEMPALPTSMLSRHPLLVAELERVQAKKEMPALDVSRYRLDAPAGPKRHDFGAWKLAVDNAHSQLEHQYLRILNLELMLKYGDKNWRAQGQLSDSLVKQYEAGLAETKKQITAINQERKLSQTVAGSELRRAEQEYFELLSKNTEIDMACERLESEIAKMKDAAEAKAAAAAPTPAAGGPGAAAGAGAGEAAAGQGDQEMQEATPAA